MTKFRACANPSPLNGGLHCVGEDTQMQACEAVSCPGISHSFTSVAILTFYKHVYIENINDLYMKPNDLCVCVCVCVCACAVGLF